ncbi:sensory histidine kinase YfhA [Klebsiella pneumoniae]|nr:sensory histidine kinase YfhA [Klebsiella pneumoniae]
MDLVISDLRMDEMDGLQLFSEIQKGHPGMPVIILTAHGSIPDAVAATQQGVFSFLTKPVDKDALYKAIDEALEQRSAGHRRSLAPGDCNPQPADAAPA